MIFDWVERKFRRTALFDWVGRIYDTLSRTCALPWGVPGGCILRQPFEHAKRKKRVAKNVKMVALRALVLLMICAGGDAQQQRGLKVKILAVVSGVPF